MHNFDFKEFVTALDAGQKAHLEWTRRILRSAVLHTLPDEDVIHHQAHKLCHFGQFLTQHRIVFSTIDLARTKQLITVHQLMHDAIREIAPPLSQGLAGNAEDLDRFEQYQAELIDHLAYFKTQAICHYTQIDNLTGLPLRQRLAHDFEKKQKQCKGNMALMFVDVDHFKSINDLYGHNIGDDVLQNLVAQIHGLLDIRQSMYRYGGEEFIIMLCETKSTQAASLAEQIRHTLSLPQTIKHNGDTIQISVTIGVALAHHQEPLLDVIDRADKAMYYGKKQGRNCVVYAEELAARV